MLVEFWGKKNLCVIPFGGNRPACLCLQKQQKPVRESKKNLPCVCIHLHRDDICQSPNNHCVQAPISHVYDSASQRLHISAAVQLVPQFQLVFTNTKQQYNCSRVDTE